MPSWRDQLGQLRLDGTFGYGDEVVGFDSPCDVEALPDGACCVADWGSRRLQIFSRYVNLVCPSGIRLIRPATESTFQPVAVACDGEALFVSEALAHQRVIKLRLDEGYVGGAAMLASYEFGPDDDPHRPGLAGRAIQGGSVRPGGLCVSNGTLFVCSRGLIPQSSCIHGFDLMLRKLYTFGDVGSTRRGAFRAPSAIAAHEGCLYVADELAHHVTVWELKPGAAAQSDGIELPSPPTFRRGIGSEGDAPGLFNGPSGVGIVGGVLVVSERSGRRVQVLTLEGGPLQVLSIGSDTNFRVCSVLGGLCVSGPRVWVADSGLSVLHALSWQRKPPAPTAEPHEPV